MASKQMTRLRLILKSIPSDSPTPHPEAKPGTGHDLVRASDKHIGNTYSHYAQRDSLYFVATPNPGPT